MAIVKSFEETARLTRLSHVHNLELLTATYVTHIFPRHFHETFVIEIVETGVDEFYCRGRNHIANADSIVLINPLEVHTGRSAGKVPLVYRSMYPPVELLLEVAAELEGYNGDLPIFSSNVICDSSLAKYMLQAHYLLEQGGDPLELHSLLLSALSKLILRHADKCKFYDFKPITNGSAPVRRAKEYLLENFSKNVTLELLAQVSGVSPFHLLRVFRSAFGLPPYEFLVNLRVERAKQLLTIGYPIAQVAFETGFYDQSHLTRHFKHIVGVTPGQYLKK